MTIQRRHLEFIASVLRDIPISEHDVDTVANMFADALEDANPNFNRERFLKAAAAKDFNKTE